jgi:hypothetical protein
MRAIKHLLQKIAPPDALLVANPRMLGPRSWIALAVAAMTIALVSTPFLALWSSNDFQECRAYQGQYPTAQNDQGKTAPVLIPPPGSVQVLWQCAYGFANANAGAITALAFVSLTVVTSGLLIISYLRFTTTRAETRAYVMVAEAHLENIEAGQIPRAVIIIKNFGQTPAYQLTQWARVGIEVSPLKNAPPEVKKDKKSPTRVLPPQGEITIRPVYKAALKADAIAALKAGTHAVYVEGRIEYRDAFNRTQHTSYLLFSGGKIGFTGELAAYITGNDAT